MCGIFAYLNFKVNRERRYILQVLFNGLRRLEYRGYDSAGIAIDSSSQCCSDGEFALAHPLLPPLVFRQEGNIESLVKSVYKGLIRSSFFYLLLFFLFLYRSFNCIGDFSVTRFLSVWIDRSGKNQFEFGGAIQHACRNCAYSVGYSRRACSAEQSSSDLWSGKRVFGCSQWGDH